MSLETTASNSTNSANLAGCTNEIRSADAGDSSQVEWIDTHTHLNDETFANHWREVVAEAVAAGVSQMLVIGIDTASSRQALALAEQHDRIFAVVGIQPNSLARVQPGDWERIVQWSTHPRVVALGETGMDHYWKAAPPDLQRDYFVRHLELSQAIRKPVVIHCREAEADTVAVLRAWQERTGAPIPAVMHSFAGTASTAKECLEMGLFLSFAGMLTFKSAADLRQVAAATPRDRLFVETDSPYLTPHPFRGQKPNRPSLVIHTGACLADLHQVSSDLMAKVTTTNARQFFQLPTPVQT